MSDTTFHFLNICATSVNTHPSSCLYYNSHYMFRLNWPSSCEPALCLKKLLFRVPIILLRALFYVDNFIGLSLISVFMLILSLRS
jgi:hypothetical protein